MFDFNTSLASPVKIRVDDAEYALPRFMQPQLAEWCGRREGEIINTALSQIEDKRERARLLMLMQPPPIDLLDAMDHMRTPSGVAHVIRACCKSAGVDSSIIDRVLSSCDPAQLSMLAGKLTSLDDAPPMIDSLAGVETQEPSADPLSNASGDTKAIADASQSTG